MGVFAESREEWDANIAWACMTHLFVQRDRMPISGVLVSRVVVVLGGRCLGLLKEDGTRSVTRTCHYYTATTTTLIDAYRHRIRAQLSTRSFDRTIIWAFHD